MPAGKSHVANKEILLREIERLRGHWHKDESFYFSKKGGAYLPIDYDLRIIQDARDAARKAKDAQDILMTFDQAKLDAIVKAMAEAATANAEWLARIAVDETKYGIYEHKVIKNLFASDAVYHFIKDMKTVGIIKEDKEKRVVEVAVPVGVVMGIIPPQSHFTP